MNPVPVILIFDIGKTNKKVLLFDEEYHVRFEEEVSIPGLKDEDGFVCDDLIALIVWMKEKMRELINDPRWDIKAINFSTFGASLIHIDKVGNPVTPLYSYLKTVDEELLNKFYAQFGEKEIFSLQTGSPALDMLNSGLQLYWLKYRRPDAFAKIQCTLHFPQYLAYVFSGKCQADISSIGCHTGLWDFYQKKYHDWLDWEDLRHLLPEPQPFDTFNLIEYEEKKIMVGIGMHDSSASLLPFTSLSASPSAILSTGTWNITLLPSFNGSLKEDDYNLDCLYYLLETEQPVAAARIYLGNEMEFQLKKLNDWFNKPVDYHIGIIADINLIKKLLNQKTERSVFIPETMGSNGTFKSLKGDAVDLKSFSSFEEAYHKLMIDMAWMQKTSMDILLSRSPVQKVYVTGGFAKNKLFMLLLRHFYPNIEFYRASVNNGTALGAALALHKHWNSKQLSGEMLELIKEDDTILFDIKDYSPSVGLEPV